MRSKDNDGPPSPIQRDLDLGAQRHAVAAWRDRQIMAIDDLFNHAAIKAREAFDQELDKAPREATFNPGPYAVSRIDSLLATQLAPHLPALITAASEELAHIDPSLADVARTLVADIAVPDPRSDVAEIETEPEPVPAQAAKGLSPGEAVRRVAALADGAVGAADGLIREPLRVRPRLREAAAARVEDHWMRLTGEPASVMARIIIRLDAVAQEARRRLT